MTLFARTWQQKLKNNKILLNFKLQQIIQIVIIDKRVILKMTFIDVEKKFHYNYTSKLMCAKYIIKRN